MMNRTSQTLSTLMIAILAVAAVPDGRADDEVRAIGSRRELFVDRYLIDTLDGAELRLATPRPAETVLRFDRPYEGVFAGYVTVLKDADTYRMYYRGLAASKKGEALHSLDTEVTCYAESRDGIKWHKPDLGLYELHGSRDNNVILAHSPACHNFAPFLDTRPGVPADERYKAVGGKRDTGLLAFVSADAVRWRLLRDEPIITGGAFDSQNVVFYSEHEGCYVCYYRTSKKIGGAGYRWITRTTSSDFLHWAAPTEMHFGDAPPEQYYTNQTLPYFRAPHLYVALFARFWPGRRVISDETARELDVVGDYANDCSDAVLMTSRGGAKYDRTFLESFIRPGPGAANWVSRTNYPARGIVPTGPGDMSCYVQREYAQPGHHLQRCVLRTDGFASVHAGYNGGEMTTHPLTFSGKRLALNYSTSAAGSLRAEIQDADGTPIAGYALADSIEMIGDELDGLVSFKSGRDVSKLAGRPVRIRFVLKDADLYAMRFVE